MLWVDDDAYEFSGVVEGFIKESTFMEDGKLKGKIQHFWLKLGDHYEQMGNPVHELVDAAKDFVTIIDDGSQFSDIADNEDTLKRAIEVMKKYDIVMLDLFLMKIDNVLISSVAPKEPMLSMKIFHELQNIKSRRPTVKLYSKYSAEGNIDDLWINLYNLTCNHKKDPIEPFIYARKSLSKYSGQYSVFRENQLIREILGER